MSDYLLVGDSSTSASGSTGISDLPGTERTKIQLISRRHAQKALVFATGVIASHNWEGSNRVVHIFCRWSLLQVILCISRSLSRKLVRSYILASRTRDTDQLKIDIVCRNAFVYRHCIRVKLDVNDRASRCSNYPVTFTNLSQHLPRLIVPLRFSYHCHKTRFARVCVSNVYKRKGQSVAGNLPRFSQDPSNMYTCSLRLKNEWS